MPTETSQVVLFDDESAQDPYPLYERLRQQGPVHRAVTARGLNVWVVTRYEEARAALADPRLAKGQQRLLELLDRHLVDPARRVNNMDVLLQHMLNSDPPDHTRLRRLVGKAFTSRRIEALRPRIEEITDELLTAMESREQVDLIDNFAFPLPITVICELLGVPMDDRDDFRDWSNTIVGAGDTEQIREASNAMVTYLLKNIAEKRATPGDDMFTALVTATDDEDRLSETELVSMVFLLLVAGHETTVNLIGNGMLGLLRHPDQLARLRADESLVPGAIEEFLRYDPPVTLATFRYTTEPVTIGDVEVPAGEFVMVSLGAGNRDEGKFPEADRLDVTRTTNGHLSFGHGIHYCLGAPLARLEAEIAVRELLRRFPNLALAGEPDELTWRSSVIMRGLSALPVRL